MLEPTSAALKKRHIIIYHHPWGYEIAVGDADGSEETIGNAVYIDDGMELLTTIRLNSNVVMTIRLAGIDELRAWSREHTKNLV